MNEVKLSIVIGVHNAWEVIGECLKRLAAQGEGRAVEIIVADSSTDGSDEIVRERFPRVKLLHFEEPLNLPRLRGEGITAAQGEIVAILDPYSMSAEDWVERALSVNIERPELAIGGVVDLFEAKGQSLSQWAVYIHEYGGFLSPMQEGHVSILPGSNITYKREAFGQLEDMELGQSGFWKAFANWHLEEKGQRLWLDPKLRVELNKPIPFWDFFRTRYRHGRCLAGMRGERMPGHERLLRGLTAPFLPPLFEWRLWKAYWPKGRYRDKFLKTIPHHLLLHASWAWGEMWGYLLGAGISCSGLYY